MRNGVTVSKQSGKLMRLLHHLLRKKLLPFVSVEGLKTQAAKSLKFRHTRIRQKVPKAYSATTMIKKLIDLFQDTIEGAPTSKPAISKQLENEQLDKTLFKDNTVVQIVSRLKHERKRKQSNKGLGDN